jgi:hypothetical protein
MIAVYAKLKNKEALPGAITFADVDDYRGALDTRWYYVLPPPPASAALGKYLKIEAEAGVYRLSVEPEVAYLLVWLALAGERQVWHVYSKHADFSAIVEMAEEFSAVVFVDSRVASEFWESLTVPPHGFKRAVIIINAPVSAPALRMRFLTALDDVAAVLKRVLQTDDLTRFYYTRKFK